MPWLSVVLGLIVLYAGAEGMVRGGSGLAERFGVSPLVVGLTVVAFGTSMPELVVSVEAALAGRGGIAVGNVVGSNIANVGLILGAAALLRPPAVRMQLLRIDVPLLCIVSAASLLLLRDGWLGRPEGLILALGVVGYTVLSVRLARSEGGEVQQEFASAFPRRERPVHVDSAFLVGGLLLLAVGARALVSGAVAIAGAFGVDDALIGLTVVAVGTSLPELATSLVAAARDEGDIAIGNVVGSNIFNLLGILGAASLMAPLDASRVSQLDLLVMLVFALVLVPIMWTGMRVSRVEGAGLLAAYLVYMGFLIA